MKDELIIPMDERYEDYIQDETGFSGYADSISFPETEEEVRTIVGIL